MSKHSPGPWHVYVTNGQYIGDAENISVATCLHQNDGAREIANARLIAAAPEMLALLRRWADSVHDGDDQLIAETETILARLDG